LHRLAQNNVGFPVLRRCLKIPDRVATGGQFRLILCDSLTPSNWLTTPQRVNSVDP
jgi:hypothetical protein